MRIDDFYQLQNFIFELNNNELKEGSTVNGEIIDILDEYVFLNIEDLGLIRAENRLNVDDLKGKKISFTVKLLKNGKIELVPLLNENVEEVASNSDDNLKKLTISKILKEYGILEDDITRELLETLFEYNIPINSDNINREIKIIDKLEDIFNKTLNEKIILFNDSQDPIKEDIKKFIIVEKDDYPEKNDLNFIYNEIRNLLPNGKVSSEFIKIITFLIKNQICVSLNNLKNLNDIMENKELIPEKLLNIVNIVEGKNEENIYKKQDIQKIFHNGKINIAFSKENAIAIKDYYKNLGNELKKIKGILKNDIDNKNLNIYKNAEKDIKELMYKIDFLNEINEKMTFVYVPMTIKNFKENNAITILKKKKGSFNGKDKVNFFINLNMEYLGNVKVYCEVFDDLINLNFSLNNDNVYLFKSNEAYLTQKLSEKGYRLNSINYVLDEEVNLINTLIENHEPYYFLDVKV